MDPAETPKAGVEEGGTMLFQRSTRNAPTTTASPNGDPGAAVPRQTRRERREQKARAAAEADLAARIGRAQRRLAHARGPLPVTPTTPPMPHPTPTPAEQTGRTEQHW